MAMNDFFESSHIVESLYSESGDKLSSSAFKALPKVQQCISKSDVSSADCRLAMSKLISANANAMYVPIREHPDAESSFFEISLLITLLAAPTSTRAT